MEIEKLKATERTEEVQHIIERMPTRFGFWVSMIVAILFSLLLFFGWMIRYPDVIQGQIVINGNSTPLKLIANSSGKLRLNHIKSKDEVKEGQILAYLENSTHLKSVIHIDSLLRLYNPSIDEIIKLNEKLPKTFSLGELNQKYYAFKSVLEQFVNDRNDHLFEHQEQSLRQLLQEQEKAAIAAQERINISKNNIKFISKFYTRDSTLFAKKVISESELDKTQLTYISSKDAYQNALSNLISTKQQLQQTSTKLQELNITRPEKEQEIRTALISAYNDLNDNIKSWEQKYVLRSPYNGKVQFMKFYTENQFVENGESIFTIIPYQSDILGQVILPAQGAGKIMEGQEVIVKLNNYPYMEYGAVTGYVNSISLTTSQTKTEKADIDTYQILVNFPNKLKTNYGTTLIVKPEAKGTAEIITKDRRLIQRLFDNLKYSLNK